MLRDFVVFVIAIHALHCICHGQSPIQQDKAAAAPFQRSDSFETKIRLLEAAWKNQDFDLASSLTHSLRDTVVQTQHEEQPSSESIVPVNQFQSVAMLAKEWQEWARGWKYFKVITVEETVGEPRRSEPIEIALSFPVAQVVSLAREVRLAAVRGGQLVQLPSQVFGEVRRGDQVHCNILFMIESQPHQKQDILVFLWQHRR